jgi:hypothetical protein
MRRAHKKGGVDLSAFHATQGRRIFTLNIRYIPGFVSNPDEIHERARPSRGLAGKIDKPAQLSGLGLAGFLGCLAPECRLNAIDQRVDNEYA